MRKLTIGLLIGRRDDGTTRAGRERREGKKTSHKCGTTESNYPPYTDRCRRVTARTRVIPTLSTHTHTSLSSPQIASFDHTDTDDDVPTELARVWLESLIFRSQFSPPFPSFVHRRESLPLHAPHAGRFRSSPV